MVLHIFPVNDIQEHITDDYDELGPCPCEPSVRIENGNMFYIHNSFDRREKVENLLNEVNNNINQ